MDFELQPNLQGTLIELRPLTPQDLDALYAAANDPLIWEQHPEKRDQREVFQRFFDSAIESKGAFAILDRKTGKMIGSSRYWNLVPGKEIEIGWTFLARDYWGGVYNGELKQLMVEHALRFVERVIFVVNEKNYRSQKAVEKIGGTLIGREERPAPDGSVRRNVVFAITREAWRKAHA
jgi:N-acetyltransferase